MGAQNTISIFDRLPDCLFRPLAAQNRRHYWAILTALLDDYFSADAPIIEHGYTHRDIVVPIERYLQSNPDWCVEDGEEPGTPINSRANAILSTFVATGWLEETQIGLRRVVEMPPDIVQFLDSLIAFADHGPQFVGGKVQMIYNQLRQVMDNPAGQAEGFHEAAMGARMLVNSLSATRGQIKKIMKELRETEEASQYIHRFFADYIGQIYIGDYKELRTSNHPLRHRFEIVEMVNELRLDPEKRAQLLGWYEKSAWGRHTPEQSLSRDIENFLVFERIEAHLGRLNAVVDQMNAQAIAFVQYTQRSRSDLDQVIDTTLSRLQHLDDETTLLTGLAPGRCFSTESLRPPTQERELPKRTVIARPTLTPEQKAVNRLMRAMRRNRVVTPKILASHLDAILGERQEISTAGWPVATVQDLCRFLALIRASAPLSASGHKRGGLTSALKEFEITQDGTRMENAYVEAAHITIKRRGS